MNYPLLALLLLAGLSLRAQDTVYVYDGLDRLSEPIKKEKASYYLLTHQPQRPFQGDVKFFDKTTHHLYAHITYNPEGKRSGKATYFYKEGSRKCEFTYVNGVMEGLYTNWYRNGQQMNEGIASPITKTYQPPGNTMSTYQVTDYLLLQYWDSLGNQLVKEGTGEYLGYHKEGGLELRGHYRDGRKEGDWLGYRNDGSLSFEETYQKGELLLGTSYRDGAPYTYTVLEDEAQPEGGMVAFYQFLAKNIKYPKKAIKARKMGTVYVRFVIDENGRVIDAESIEGRELGYGLDEEAIRVIYLTKWTPGKQKGLSVKQRKILPIKFSL